MKLRFPIHSWEIETGRRMWEEDSDTGRSASATPVKASSYCYGLGIA